MNIKPITSSESYQVSAASQAREDARDRRQEKPRPDEKKKAAAVEAPVPARESEPLDGSDAILRESQSVDSESVIEMLSHRPIVNLHAAKAFLNKASQTNTSKFTDKKKVNKTL